MIAFIVLAATVATPVLQQAVTDLSESLDDALSSSQAVAPGEIPEGLTAEEWADIQSQIAALQASQTLAPQVTVEPVATPTQRLGRFADASYATAGATFTFNGQTVRLSTVSVGGPIAAAAPAELDDRVVYDRGVVEEWFVETDNGIEQGWTIAEAPAGVTDELVIEVAASTDLVPLPVSDDTIHFIDNAGNVLAQYTGLLAWDADGVDLPAAMTYAGDRIEITVDVAGAAYPITVDPTFTQDQTLVPVATRAGDRHGFAVAAYPGALTGGNTWAVATTPGSDSFGDGIGSFSVYSWDIGGGQWILDEEVTPNPIGSPAIDDRFGWSAAVHDDIIAIGATQADSGRGAVYIYRYDGADWQPNEVIYECDPSGGACGQTAGTGTAGNEFGFDVSFIDTDTLVVGSPGSDAGPSDGGVVYVYEDLGGGFVLQTTDRYIGNPNDTAGDLFGHAIDTDAAGNIIVGAPKTNPGGAAYWFNYNGATVTGPEVIGSSVGFDPGAQRGFDVAIFDEESGPDTRQFLVAATNGENFLGGPTGAAQVNNYAGALGGLPGGGAPFRAGAVDLPALATEIRIDASEDGLIIGLPDSTMAPHYAPYDEGVNIFQAATPVDNGSFSPNAEDDFGNGVALINDGDTKTILVGAQGLPEQTTGRAVDDAGRVFVYDLGTAGNPELQQIDSFASDRDDSFGSLVAIDGNFMAVAANGDDNEVAGAGAIYLYERATESDPWILVDVINRAEGDAADDRFVSALVVDGTTVAASVVDFLTTDDAVYVWQEVGFPGGEWTQKGATITYPGSGNRVFGQSLAFGRNNNHLLIGGQDAPATGTVNDVNNRGAVFETFYQFGTSSWDSPVRIAGAVDGGRNFGSAMDSYSDGSTVFLVVGDSFDADFSNLDQGGAFTIFERPTDLSTGWSVVAKIGGDFRLGGGAVRIDNNRVVATGFNNVTLEASAYVFEGPGWSSVPVATLVGTQYNFTAIDLNLNRFGIGTDSGTVELYNLPASGTLTTPDDVFDPTGATNFFTVALDDGITVAAGDDGLNGGAGRVFEADFAPTFPVIGEPNVDIDGRWAIWGDPENDAAYVLEFSGGSWNLEETLTGTAGSSFGASVAVDERTFLVGAPGDDSAGADAGVVRHFHRDGTGGDMGPVATYSGTSAGDQLGFAVELLGERAYLGAPGNAAGGFVEVWNNVNATSGTLFQTLSEGIAGDEFGAGLATTESGARLTVVVGSPGEAGAAGAVRVYASDNGLAYGEIDAVTLPATAGNRAGSDLDAAYLSFNRLAVMVSAPGTDEAYYALINPTDGFETTTPLSTLVTPAAGFGSSVSMSGDRLIVGSDSDAYVYRATRTGVNNVNTSTEIALDPTITDVAIEGRLGLAVPPSTGFTGIELEAADLTEPAELRGTFDFYPSDKLVSPVARDDDDFGVVAADGDTIIVGAPGAYKDEFSDEFGRVFVFVDNGTNYVFSQELDGDFLGFDFGRDVEIVGNTAVVISENNVAWYTRPNAGAQFSFDGSASVPGGFTSSVDTDGQTLIVGANADAYVWEGGPGSWTDGGEITISNGTPGFGRDVAVSGNVIYVSLAPLPVSGTPVPADYGTVEVWINEGGGTIEFTGTTLTGDRTGSVWSDFYGIKIDADGDQLIVGASYDLDRAGGAYLYDCPEAGLVVSCSPAGFFDGGGFQGAEFGHDVQVDGDNAIVSARQSGGVVFAGDTILLRRVNGTWQRTTQLFEAPDADAIDQYVNLALTDTAIVMGGPEEDGRGNNAGAVTVFPIPDPDEVVNTSLYSDQFDIRGFGISVDVDGDTMVVGDRLGGINAEGLAYVFDRTADGVWQFTQELDGGFGTGANGGQSVAIEGDRIVIGAPFQSGASVGGIAVFERSGGVWSQNGAVLTSPTGGGWLGYSVDIEGDRIVAGAPQRNVGADLLAGGFSIFDRSGGGVWSFTADVNLPTPEPQSRMGWDTKIDGGDVFAISLRSELVTNIATVHRFAGATTFASTYQPTTLAGPFLDLDVSGGVAAIVNVDGEAILHTIGTATEVPILTTEDNTDAVVINAIAFDGSNVVVAFDTAGGPVVEEFSSNGVTATFVGTRTPEIIGGSVVALDLASDGTLSMGVLNQSNARGLVAGSVFTADLSVAPDDPVLQFDLALAAGQSASVPVAPGGIAIAEIDAELLAGANDGESTLAASPLGRTEINDAPIVELKLDDTPIPQAILDNPALYNLALIDVDLNQPGGWTAILEGTEFEDRPLVDITLGEVLDATVDSQVATNVASLPLGALDVNGTPLGALPLGALILGDTPIGALPLGALGLDVCDVFADGFPAGTSCTDIQNAVNNISVTEAALQGLQLGALPLGALPLGALDLQALGLDSVPLGALPLGALPLGALPLGALGLEGIPLGALPLGALELNGIPLGALEVEGAPLGALPLGALPLGALVLGDEQLSSLPVPEGYADWCEVLAEIDAGYDCSVNPAAVDETIVGLGLRGVPLGALPLGALPLGALDVSGTPIGALDLTGTDIGALPLGALPLGALPLGALPLGALDVSGLPLGALPLGALTVSDIPLGALEIQGSPLGALPLGALDVAGLPLGALPLGALPLGALPLGALPLGALEVQGSPLGALPLGALDVLSSPLGALPLGALPLGALPLGALDCGIADCESDTIGDAILSGALDPNLITFDQIGVALGDISVGDLAPYFFTITPEELEAAADASTLTLGDLLNYEGITLGDLPLDDPLVSLLVLGDIEAALGDISLLDLGTALGVSESEIATVLGALLVSDLENLGDITVGEAFADENATSTVELDSLGAILGLIDIEQMILAGFATAPTFNGETLDDAIDLGALTLADLITLAGIPEYDSLPFGVLLDELATSGNLLGFVLADLLAALVGLEDVAFGSVDFTEVEAGSLPAGTVPDVMFRAGFQVTDTVNAQSVVVDVELPTSATYVPGTATVNDGTGPIELEPTVDGNTLSWTVFGVDADEPHLIQFDVRPEVSIGSTSLNGRGRIVGSETTIPASTSVTVSEGLENNDYPLVTQVVDDTVYLTYISTRTDIDVFEVTVNERDRLAIQLSNLTADLDLVLYGIPDDTAVGSALGSASDEAPLSPITNPDATDVESEPLDDFPRLDLENPADGLQLLEVSNAAGESDELIVTDPLPAGTYYVQVHGANGARNQEPATLQIQTLEAEARPPCSTLTDILGGPLPAATPGTIPTDLTGNTLFLVNEQRLEQLYGATGRADVMNSLEALVLYLESDPTFGLDPIVIPVEAYAGVQAAYAAWDDPVNAEDACDPEVANDVVSAIIANAIDPIRDQLDHLVVVGGDDIIPMARLQDATEIANEYDYRTEFEGDLNGANAGNVSSFTATFWESRYLSDDPYGESAARSLGNRFLYVPDVALGRLVETPAEIASALDHFVTFQGSLDMNTAAVLGYDFLTDSSAEIAAEMTAAGLTVDDDLADGIDSDDGLPWDRLDAGEIIVPATGDAPDLVSFNAHFDHYRALPAAGDQVPNFNDNFETSAIADALPSSLLEGTIIFSAGCHGGLSVSDIQIGATNLDWAQAAAQGDALWIGNTGFGYGDTEIVAYTERLMALFAEEVLSPIQLPGAAAPSTVGQAWTVAKNRFVAENAALSVYDEKASMEATFFGLPFYRVGLAAEPAPPAPQNSPTPDATGTPSIVETVDSANTIVSTSRGEYYANIDSEGNEEIISSPGRPVQPKTSTDISVVDPADTTELSQIAHGGLILDMTSTYVGLPDPVIASVVVDESSAVPEPPVPDSIFPARPLTISTSTTATGERQTLSIATGQYRPGPAVQRLDDDIDVLVYYADPAETDFNAPRINNVESTVEDGQLTITLQTQDDANGVDRVYILLAENAGSGTVDWVGFDLGQVGTTSTWAGSFELDSSTTQLEFIVQAKDGVGNIGYANNKASNFNDDTQPEPEPPTPVDLEVELDQTNADPNGSNWFTGDVVVAVTTDTVAGYSVDGAPFQEIQSGESFTVTGDGIHTVEIRTPEGESFNRLVRIDTTGIPEFTAGTPMAFASYGNDQSVIYDFLCTDPSLVSCDASVNGVAVELNDPLPTTPGSYLLTVVTADALGNDATYTVPFDITAPLNNLPEISLITGPSTPQLISDGVTVDVTFGDADGVFDDYTVDIDWGDFDDDDTPGSSTICSASSGSATSGNPSCEIVQEPTGGAADGQATGSFVYDEPGVYAIEVTITDSSGNTDSTLFEFAVVYDPEGGRVSGAGWYWSGPEAYSEEEPWGGPAFFGYRARYRNGDDTPRGRTKLHLLGEFFFKSTSYDYLIVNDTIAVAEGTGRVGWEHGYRFRVQGIDNGRLDFFQITIWDDDTGEVVYDNGILYDEGDVVLLGGIRVKS
ncbi:MAG: FG-GAP repeat protein [Actinomycetota bacterium]